MTVLYVAPPANGGKKRSRGMADAMLKDIVALGESYDVDAQDRGARRDRSPTKPSSRRWPSGRHNLIVMGVERRPGEKLFFGETATAILEKSDRSIVFVVS